MFRIQNLKINSGQLYPSKKYYLNVTRYIKRPFAFRIKYEFRIEISEYLTYFSMCSFKNNSSEWGDPKILYRASGSSKNGKIVRSFNNYMLDKTIT